MEYYQLSGTLLASMERLITDYSFFPTHLGTPVFLHISPSPSQAIAGSHCATASCILYHCITSLLVQWGPIWMRERSWLKLSFCSVFVSCNPKIQLHLVKNARGFYPYMLVYRRHGCKLKFSVLALHSLQSICHTLFASTNMVSAFCLLLFTWNQQGHFDNWSGAESDNRDEYSPQRKSVQIFCFLVGRKRDSTAISLISAKPRFVPSSIYSTGTSA